jgi:hypothetical protein
MAGPCGMLVVGPTIATTEVVEDVDGEPLGGAIGGSGSGYHFRRKASMVAPLGMLPVAPIADTNVLLLLLEQMSSMAVPLGGNVGHKNDHT